MISWIKQYLTEPNGENLYTSSESSVIVFVPTEASVNLQRHKLPQELIKSTEDKVPFFWWCFPIWPHFSTSEAFLAKAFNPQSDELLKTKARPIWLHICSCFLFKCPRNNFWLNTILFVLRLCVIKTLLHPFPKWQIIIKGQTKKQKQAHLESKCLSASLFV